MDGRVDRSLNSGAKGRGFGTTFRPSLKLVMEEQQQQLEEWRRSRRRRRNNWRSSWRRGGGAVGVGGKTTGEVITW